MYLGKLTIKQTDDFHVARDYIHDTAILLFKNTDAVDALIRELKDLRQNMVVLEDVEQ